MVSGVEPSTLGSRTPPVFNLWTVQNGGISRNRTCDNAINSRALYHLSYNAVSPNRNCTGAAAAVSVLRGADMKGGAFMDSQRGSLAEMDGFEPTHTGIKVRCLTAWLHPCMVGSFCGLSYPGQNNNGFWSR